MKHMMKYQRKKKQEVLAILGELYVAVKSGRLVVSEAGFWDSRLDNSINFKFKLISRDSGKEIRKFGNLS